MSVFREFIVRIRVALRYYIGRVTLIAFFSDSRNLHLIHTTLGILAKKL